MAGRASVGAGVAMAVCVLLTLGVFVDAPVANASTVKVDCPSASSSSISVPLGASVEASWTASNDLQSVTLTEADSPHAEIYDGSGSSGVTNFTSEDTSYLVACAGPSFTTLSLVFDYPGVFAWP